jgi:hypothetical protein
MTGESGSTTMAEHARRSVTLPQERDIDMLRSLAEKRLLVYWTPSSVCCGAALLLTSIEDPDPAAQETDSSILHATAVQGMTE